MRMSDWSSDVCSSDLLRALRRVRALVEIIRHAVTVEIGRAAIGVHRHALGRSGALVARIRHAVAIVVVRVGAELPAQASGCRPQIEGVVGDWALAVDEVKVVTTFERSEEHTSELQSLMRISYAVYFLKNKN